MADAIKKFVMIATSMVIGNRLLKKENNPKLSTKEFSEADLMASYRDGYIKREGSKAVTAQDAQKEYQNELKSAEKKAQDQQIKDFEKEQAEKEAAEKKAKEEEEAKKKAEETKQKAEKEAAEKKSDKNNPDKKEGDIQSNLKDNLPK